MFRLAVRLFQYGSIAYTTKVNIKTALSNGKKAAPPVTTSAQ
jgi:ABC-2 type transport system permease protein